MLIIEMAIADTLHGVICELIIEYIIYLIRVALIMKLADIQITKKYIADTNSQFDSYYYY